MFSSDIYGYKKEEVDKFIDSLKTEHEKALMEEKLKVLDAERKVLEIKNKAQEIENREKNILNVLETYRKAQNEGNRNIDILRGEQLKMVYNHLQAFLVELNNKCPGVLLNNSYKKLVNEIEIILASTQEKVDEVVETGTTNDPMRLLLSKMQGKKVQDTLPKEVKEVKIERTDSKERTSLIKPVTEMQLNEDDKYDNLVDKFLNSKPEEPLVRKPVNSGFDLKEAVNPTEDLSEIMKAFDFYSNGDNEG